MNETITAQGLLAIIAVALLVGAIGEVILTEVLANRKKEKENDDS